MIIINKYVDLEPYISVVPASAADGRHEQIHFGLTDDAVVTCALDLEFEYNKRNPLGFYERWFTIGAENITFEQMIKCTAIEADNIVADDICRIDIVGVKRDIKGTVIDCKSIKAGGIACEEIETEKIKFKRLEAGKLIIKGKFTLNFVTAEDSEI